ncbi:hypothetical protein DFR58_14712 [Anaerobacterium chartisolvens]|uniref:Uncharacterized protein n=1 Tax=Anaerobacterium chartisolvens TaxID=1297424 RepID=A0A369AEX5_9FIRM|nr:hypothetical protein [Anaerobacterium chartisolvens]RCX07892.1 hypothetical protein DFR58_14712 [Anaerobacterium chartisolvens]
MGRGYCPEQLSYLEEKIGQMSIKSIARQLGKKPKSLDTYRKRKNIPSGRMAADGISVAIFSEAAL